MNKLDRAGTFKARPVAMGLQNAKESKSVAVWIEFQITAQQEGEDWTDWTGYEDHSIVGYFWIVKKDGSVNTRTVENLAEVLDWDGNPDTIMGDPPDISVQITVAEDTYQGRTSLKVQWLNPVDYQGGIATATPEQVQQIKVQFGSLLRAAAGAARKTKAAPKPLPKVGQKATATAAANAAPSARAATQMATIDDGALFDPNDPNAGLGQ